MKNEAESTTRVFLNVLQVVEYLKTEGWKIAKSAAYEHVKEGMLRPREDGNFTERDVLKYARTFLKMKDGSPASRELESLSKEKAQTELRKLKAEAEIKEQKAQVLAGNLVPRSSFEFELAARAVLFRQDLMNFAHRFAPEIIHLVSGDFLKTNELIDLMKDKFGDFLHHYSNKKKEFTITKEQLQAELIVTAEESDDEEGETDE